MKTPAELVGDYIEDRITLRELEFGLLASEWASEQDTGDSLRALALIERALKCEISEARFKLLLRRPNETEETPHERD